MGFTNFQSVHNYYHRLNECVWREMQFFDMKMTLWRFVRFAVIKLSVSVCECEREKIDTDSVHVKSFRSNCSSFVYTFTDFVGWVLFWRQNFHLLLQLFLSLCIILRDVTSFRKFVCRFEIMKKTAAGN